LAIVTQCRIGCLEKWQTCWFGAKCDISEVFKMLFYVVVWQNVMQTCNGRLQHWVNVDLW
jgi:hypothetical protein